MATLQNTATGGRTIPEIGFAMLGLNFNQTRAPGKSQSLWFGEWQMVDGTRYPAPFGIE